MLLFEKVGKHNTEQTLALSLKTARERGIKDIVIATSSGYTPELLGDVTGLNIIIVTHVFGFHEPGVWSLTQKQVQSWKDKGCKVVTAAHALSGAERSISNKHGGIYPVQVIADTLRMFSQGMKVCVEIAAMAADAGLVLPKDQIIAIGGTGRGADTAVIMRAANSARVLDTKIDEVLCKPFIG